MKHKTAYKVQTVCPARIIEALRYLIKTPLFRKHDIKIDPKFVEEFDEHDFETYIEFVVEKDDIKMLRKMESCDQDTKDADNKENNQNQDQNKNEIVNDENAMHKKKLMMNF